MTDDVHQAIVDLREEWERGLAETLRLIRQTQEQIEQVQARLDAEG